MADLTPETLAAWDEGNESSVFPDLRIRRLIAAVRAEKARAEQAEADAEGAKFALGNEHDMRLAEKARADQAEATVAAVRTFADELDAGASLRWTSTVAKELRTVLGGES